MSSVTASMEGRAIARPNSGRSLGASQSMPRFNGGPGNCPAKQLDPRPNDEMSMDASMEGRAIARPNRSSDLVGLTCPFAGDCERSCKHALRRCWDSVFKLHFACVCKASSGP